jgi:hypothetical protein
MNDTQILTLAVSFVVSVSFLLFSNSRITDAKDSLRSEIFGVRDSLKAEMLTSKTEISNRLDRMEDNITRLLADHEHRIANLETGQR